MSGGIEMVGLFALAAMGGDVSAAADNGFVSALLWVQEHGSLAALDPARDQALQAAVLASVQRHQGGLALADLADFRLPTGLQQHSSLPVLDRKTIAEQLHSVPDALPPGVARQIMLWRTQFHLIDPRHRDVIGQLADWIAQQRRAAQPAPLVMVCTGNSRRSMLSAVVGNVLAEVLGLPDVRCYSGGTTPTALNPRTIQTLTALGVTITPTGAAAPPGPAGEPNPFYSIAWGRRPIVEFSKRIDDPVNPTQGFAAIIVCSEADESCPTVVGADRRFSLPLADPKICDHTPIEADKYAERRDEIGRIFLNVLLRAQRASSP